MFGWSKKQEKDPKERFKNIELTAHGLESGLKGVENHWALGNKQEGDQLFAAIYRACVGNFVEGPSSRPDEIKALQFKGLKRLTNFLDRHAKDEEAHELIAQLRAHLSEFDQDQLAFLIHWMAVAKEGLQARTGTAETRLIYYVCQSCGELNLLSTAPCVHCGFCCKTALDVRRSLFLSPNVLQVPVLMQVAVQVQGGRSQKTPVNIDQIWAAWGAGDFNASAMDGTKAWEGMVDDHLQKCMDRADSFVKPANLAIRCNNCGKSQEICTDRLVQECTDCSVGLAIPALRRMKASLLHSLTLMLCFWDHNDSVEYSNFIGKWVLVMDYALRWDAYPTKAQGLDLIERFSKLSAVSCRSGRAELKLQAGKVVAGFSDKPGVDPAGNKFIEQQVRTMNILFDLFRANELQV